MTSQDRLDRERIDRGILDVVAAIEQVVVVLRKRNPTKPTMQTVQTVIGAAVAVIGDKHIQAQIAERVENQIAPHGRKA